MVQQRTERDPAPGFFDLLAEIGITKHLGSLTATRELVELCHVDQNSTVLDVGCGVGATPYLLAEEVGCRVVGVDISRAMVSVSRQRAEESGLERLPAFSVADARDLPFETACFDVVIAESVNGFIRQRARALQEYARVTRPGGYVGLNEATWIATPPAEVVEYMRRAWLEPLSADQWQDLMRQAGLRDVMGVARRISARVEAVDRLRRYGATRTLKAIFRAAALQIRNPGFRRFMGQAFAMPAGISDNMGVGLYVGRR